MTKQHLTTGLVLSALLVAFIALSNLAAAAPPAQDPKPTRDLTVRPRVTRDLTRNPRPTAIDPSAPTPDPRSEITQEPKPTRRTLPEVETSTPEPAPESKPKNVAVAPRRISSQLLILNPHRTGKARVIVNLFDLSGAIAFSDTVKINQNGAKLVTLPKSVGNNFLGSARLISNRRVQALVLDNTGDGTSSDVYEATNVMTGTLSLPFVRHLAPTTKNSIIAIQNTSSAPADATLTAYDVNGVEVLTHPVAIPPSASVYVNTDDLFGTNTFLGSARITSNRTIAAAELSMNMQDTASFDALTPRDESSKHIIPGVERKRRKDGQINAWNELYVRNNGTVPTDITVKYFNKKGQVKGTVKRTNVPPGGLAIFIGKDSEFDFLGKKYTGWAAVNGAPGSRLAVHSLSARVRGKQWMGVESILRERVNGRGVCGYVRSTEKTKSVVSILNTHKKKNALVHVRFYSHAKGKLAGSLDIVVKPNETISLTAQNGIPANFQGIALVNSDTTGSQKVVSMVTTQTLDGKRIRSINGYLCR